MGGGFGFAFVCLVFGLAMEGPGLGRRGREASLCNPTGFSSWFRGRPRASRRGAHARIPVALARSISREREPASTVRWDDGGVTWRSTPLWEGAPNPLPSSIATTVESRKGSKALGPTKWGRPCSAGKVDTGFASTPVRGRVEQGLYERGPARNESMDHPSPGGQGRGTGPVVRGGYPDVSGAIPLAGRVGFPGLLVPPIIDRYLFDHRV